MIEQLEQKVVIKSNKKENKKNLNLSKRIDNVLKNINERNPVRLRDYTPQVLVENGVKDLPMYENPSHIRKNILTEQEARKLGLSVRKNDHYHGLTTLKDKNNNNIIVPIELETVTDINKLRIYTNRIKSVYGKTNLNNYIKKNINQNEFVKIYEQKKNKVWV